MIAEFYLVTESFAYNVNLTTSEIEVKTKSLARDFVYIRKYNDANKIFVHPDIYNVHFLDGILLSDLLFNPQLAKTHIDRDVYNALQKIILESNTTEISSREVIEILLPEHDQDLCHGLIAFNQVENVEPELQIVYHLKGWFDFRRYFLGLYPKNEKFYIDECIKYFPHLFFHENNRESIKAIFKDCPQKIIYHLAALNDTFKNIDTTNRNRTQILEAFSIIAELDETASLEGNADRKTDFTFGFLNDQNQMENVCCEPHMKLCYSDTNTAYSNARRIYFHEGISNIQNGRILIGHIGKHL